MLGEVRFRVLQTALMALTLLLALMSLCLGQYHLPLGEVLRRLMQPQTTSDIASQIVWSVRFPRVMMAFLCSAALGLSGATLQGVFRNPLVDPHIIGVTSGSAFGGTLAILLGLSPVLMMGSTFGFGLAALGLVYLVAIL
jgi:iron complex transport system permease protein